MTNPVLKKLLAQQERKMLENIICSLYEQSDYAEQFINLRLLDSEYEKKLLEQYQKNMHQIFFPANIMKSGFSLSKAKEVIADFKKVCKNKELIAELKLCFVEYAAEFTSMYGDINEKFYESMFAVYQDVIEAVAFDENLYRKWKHKLLTIIHNTEQIGWNS